MEESVEQRIKKLLASQLLAVLSTHDRGAPYANLITFAAARDMKHIFFATSRLTRKFANLQADSRVSFLIDSRSSNMRDFQQISAITALGYAEEITGTQARDAAARLNERHPGLTEFLQEPFTAFFRVTVTEYIVVTGLRDVMHLYLDHEEPATP